MTYADTIRSGANGQLRNFRMIGDLMLASWHKLPYSAFQVYGDERCRQSSAENPNEREISLASVLKEVVNALKR